MAAACSQRFIDTFCVERTPMARGACRNRASKRVLDLRTLPSRLLPNPSNQRSVEGEVTKSQVN
jgi:hypothetical protein